MEAISENINTNYDRIASLLKDTKDKVEIEVAIDDENIVTYSPGLPIFTFGENLQDAKANALEALYLTFEEYDNIDIESRFTIKFTS